MSIQPFMTQAKVQTIRKVLTWTAPAIAIPGLRFTQDSHEQRKELFIRDASTYSIGAFTFLAMEAATMRGLTALTHTRLNHFSLVNDATKRNLTAFIVGLTANLLYAGIGAVRFSKAFSRYQAERAAKKNTPQPVTIPPKPTWNYSLPTQPNWMWTTTRVQYFA